METVSKKHLPDTNLGVYVALSKGRYIVDEDGRQLSISAWQGSRKRQAELIEVAKSYGLEDITVEFIPDVRKVSDDEYEEQQERLAEGKTPDPYDLGAMIDEYKSGRGIE